MTRTKDGYQLSTGREIYANRGILGITPDDPLVCSEGYAGGVYVSESDEDCLKDEEPKLTREERAEIADYMIALWQQFKAV